MLDEKEIIRLVTERVARRLGCYYGDDVDISEGIPIGVSVRHCHLTQEHVETLFGPGAELTVRNYLYQKGQFASNQTVTVVGSKGALYGVRVLGPVRDESQVEVARTDAVQLGVMPPIRQSVADGDGERIVVAGPAGVVDLKRALIRAKRHIHLNPTEAEQFGVKDKDLVKCRIAGGNEMVLDDVLIRTHPLFLAEMHIDTDEGNAADVICGDRAFILD